MQLGQKVMYSRLSEGSRGEQMIAKCGGVISILLFS
jgi:hypothetical protein